MGKSTLKPFLSDYRRIRLSSIEPKERKRVFKEVLFFALIMIINGYILFPLIIALIFPIQPSGNYGIASGIFHGFVFIDNLLIKLFNHSRLLIGVDQESSYYTSYYISKYAFLTIGILSFIVCILIELIYRLARAMPKTPNRMEPSIPLGEFDPSKRELRIFISSTFRDMQKIRDVLMCKAFPYIQREADERQVKIIPIDLRWGITEEESQSGKVLGICLDEIDKASPFFIGIIGNSYGWQPEKNDYSSDPLLSKKSPIISKALEEGLSVTELELKYGVEWRPYSEDSIIFIYRVLKTGSDNLDFLHRWIMDSGAFNYEEYSDIDEISRLTVVYVRKLLNKYYPISHDNAQDSELTKLEALTYPLRHFYLDDEKVTAPIDCFLNGSDKNMLVIAGEEGMGKFAAALNCAHKLTDNVLAIANSKFSKAKNLAQMIVETVAKAESSDILIFRAPLNIAGLAELAKCFKNIKPQLKIISICPSVQEIDYAAAPDICVISGFSHSRDFYRT
ncbi:MAG: DUF4062 domain-containing protein, partial [Muribaculaceae bacterium]|nr:DUF4062 domain-containing protein [Muribaculaceae bacterium]